MNRNSKLKWWATFLFSQNGCRWVPHTIPVPHIHTTPFECSCTTIFVVVVVGSCCSGPSHRSSACSPSQVPKIETFSLEEKTNKREREKGRESEMEMEMEKIVKTEKPRPKTNWVWMNKTWTNIIEKYRKRETEPWNAQWANECPKTKRQTMIK